MVAAGLTRDVVVDFIPLADRALSVDDAALVRFRSSMGYLGGYVRLPFDVIAGRTIAAVVDGDLDITVSAAEFTQWAAAAVGADPAPAELPRARNAEWLTPLPPRVGWQRIDIVEDSVVRPLIRSGVLLMAEQTTSAAQREVMSSQVLLAQGAPDSAAAGLRADVPLSALSALTRMGFVPRGSRVAVDARAGWIRLAAEYGSTFVRTGNDVLNLLSR